MPKFFLPDPDGAPTTSQVAEETYAAIKRFAQRADRMGTD
jgi:hypothetical protein